ncbi:MAG: LpxI family protein [Leptonema sp. (in: Bacteria)]|nr:LpxI family protein [Leptonema sp. (in: bacteria)]
MNRLGILAGKGHLPWIAALEAERRGEDYRVFLITNEPPPEQFADRCEKVVLTRFYSSTLKAMQQQQIRRLLLLGKSTRDIMYNKPSFDLRTLWLLARMKDRNDTTIFLTLEKILSKKGIQVIPQTDYLSNCFLEEGRYGKRLSTRELADIPYGMNYAMEVNRLDIGQCVVVGDLTVFAVECAEGTDACIERGGQLFHSRGAVVCKVSKRNHDPRFDLPTAGLQTLEIMKKSGCRVLAIESNSTIVVHKEDFLRQAKKYGITILSLKGDLTDQKKIRRYNRPFTDKS